MFLCRTFELDCAGKISFSSDVVIDANPTDAVGIAQELSKDRVVELWRGGNLIATFRPNDRHKRS